MEAQKCMECQKDIKNYKFRYCFLCSKARKKKYIEEHPDECESCKLPTREGYKLCFQCNKTKPLLESKKSYVDDYF